MKQLDDAWHVMFSSEARGSPCVWTGEVITDDMLALIISNPDDTAQRVTMSLDGLSGMTIAYGENPPDLAEDRTQLPQAEYVFYNPDDHAVHTCIQCLETMKSGAASIEFRQHTAGGHQTKSVVFCHPDCLPALCDRLSVVWTHTGDVIGDLL